MAKMPRFARGSRPCNDREFAAQSLFQLLPVPHREERPRRGAVPGRHIPPEVKARLRHQFGLDKSKWDQFWAYMRQTLSGNLGSSYRTGRPVTEEIGVAIWPTVWLVGLSTVLSTAIGLLLGIKSAWQRNSLFDRLSTGLSMFTYATPDFFLGILLLAGFAFGLKVLPTGGIEDPALPPAGSATSSIRRST